MSSPLSTLKKISRAPIPGSEGDRRKFPDRLDVGPEVALFRKHFPLKQSGSKVTQRGPKDDVDEDQTIRTCRRLQKQLQDMERFLNDYGMIWVGSNEDEEDEDEDQTSHTSAERRMARRLGVNFDLVVRNLEELNLVAGGTTVISIPGGAKLSEHPSVPLKLFRNGLMMFGGPFRSYEHPSTQRWIQDIMDGYFPSELQDRFPDGVTFQVHDRRDEDFGTEFPGRGHMTGEILSAQQFITKLPEHVVRAGNIINIRSALKTHLQGCKEPENENVVETPALQTLRERSDVGDVTSLRVKSEDGETTFNLKMFFSETVGHLRRYLDVHRGPSEAPYDIISALPHPHHHDDDSETLQSCGLIPNAALILRPRRETSIQKHQ